MEERQRKYLAAKIGITAIAILILSLWAANLRNVWNGLPAGPDTDQESWAEFRADMDRSLDDIRSRLEEASRQAAPATSTPDSPGQVEERGERVEALLQETADLASSSQSVSTSTSTTTPAKVRSDCPEWINCMPTIGGTPRPCAVPPGCEDITQIAY